jgi:hypothetical protein
MGATPCGRKRDTRSVDCLIGIPFSELYPQLFRIRGRYFVQFIILKVGAGIWVPKS